MIKDEMKENVVKEFVGLKAKMYSLILDNQESKNRAKEIKKNALLTSTHLKAIENRYKIEYLDANNLYGWAMSEYLPYGGFKWIENVQDFNVFSISETSDVGYMFEVGLDYPDHIHDQHNDLPFCAENKTPPNEKISKLLLDLENKRNYVINY